MESPRARLDVLFTAHAGAVFGFALRRTSRGEAEDIVSETFLIAWRRLDDVPDDPLPWLFGVARKVLANRRRGDRRQAALRSKLSSGQLRNVALVDDEREPDRVLSALAGLPSGERDAITLIAWEGLTPEEAAIALGCSRAALYVRVHRARRKLADLLSPRALPDNSEVDRP